MVIFIDTSSLIKRYVQEEGSGDVDRFFNEENDIIIAPITAIEFHAALNRKLRDKSISMETHHKAIAAWEMEGASYNTVSFDDGLIGVSLDMVSRYALKTLDSIQLAAAALSDAGAFVTSDKQLHEIALREFTDKAVFI
jgi:predicted nucleic acid-binding protein